MALPASHLRFAVRVADRLSVSDWSAYVSGTLYPDSRWVTGVPRDSTHDARFLDPDFATDDFTRGWHVHCVCDQVQGAVHTAIVGALASLTAPMRWIRMAAAKLVQDMQDAARVDLDRYLPLLQSSRMPNHESAADIDTYFDYIRQAYHRADTPDWDDYARLWERVGLDRQAINRIDAAVRHIRSDETLDRRLTAAFDQMMVRYAS